MGRLEPKGMIPHPSQELQRRDTGQGGSTLATLPDILLTEVAGFLGVKALGRASSVSRYLLEVCSTEHLWESLWEGPLPAGCANGGKAAHAALWLLVKGATEQAHLAVCPSSPKELHMDCHTRSRRRRIGERAGGGSSLGTTGFPVHISCMAISGRITATAAGSEICVWDVEGPVPRARFSINGHGSVTSLLLLKGLLLTGDNSGYVRRYDLSMPTGKGLQEIRAHADRVTAMDAFTLSMNTTATANGKANVTKNIGDVLGFGMENRGQSGLASRMIARSASEGINPSISHPQLPRTDETARAWDQGHGWGEGWVTVGARTGPATPGTFSATPASARAPVDAVERHSTAGRSESSWVRQSQFRRRSPARDEPGRWAEGRAVEPDHVSGFLHGDKAFPRGGRGWGRGRGGVGNRGGAGAHGNWALGGLGEMTTEKDQDAIEGSGVIAPGEALQLGKRSAYAGRGQGEELSVAAGEEEGDAEGETRKVGELRWDGNDVAAPHGAVIEEEKAIDGHELGDRVRGRTILFTGSDDGTAKAWDAATGRFLLAYNGHSRGVICLQATQTRAYGPVLVTGGGDGNVNIWELTTGRCLESLEAGMGFAPHGGAHGPRIGCLKAFEDTIVVGEDRHVTVWALERGKPARLKHRRFCEHQRPVRRLDVVGRYVVTCSGDNVIRLWDSATGECVRAMETKSGAAVTSFRLSGSLLLTASLFDASVLMTRFLPPNQDKEPEKDDEG